MLAGAAENLFPARMQMALSLGRHIVFSCFEAIYRTKVRCLDKVRRAIAAQPSSVVELADRRVAKPILAHQRQLAINETLSNIAYLRWSGEVERRPRPDGVFEWYAVADPGGSHWSEGQVAAPAGVEVSRGNSSREVPP